MMIAKVHDTSTTTLAERHGAILGDIVDIYTETGLPVGSKAIAERSNLDVSPATVRGVMADLEKGGYLASPHTSAGRIPTEDGFRYHVKGIATVDKLDGKIKKLVENNIDTSKNFDTIIDDVSHFLSNVTSCTTLVTAPRLDREELEKVEFIRLSDEKVLAVLVSCHGVVENRVIHVPSHITEDDLNNAAGRLKNIVAGQTLADARVSMMETLMEHKQQVDTMMDSMMNAAETWGDHSVSDGALTIVGSQNLFQYPELVRDQLKGLFQAFEEKRMLMALMNEVQTGAGVQIFIGTDCPLEAAKDCALITTTYGTKDKKIIGTLGVIGPMRMNYRDTVQLVDYTGKLLSNILEKN